MIVIHIRVVVFFFFLFCVFFAPIRKFRNQPTYRAKLWNTPSLDHSFRYCYSFFDNLHTFGDLDSFAVVVCNKARHCFDSVLVGSRLDRLVGHKVFLIITIDFISPAWFIWHLWHCSSLVFFCKKLLAAGCCDHLDIRKQSVVHIIFCFLSLHLYSLYIVFSKIKFKQERETECERERNVVVKRQVIKNDATRRQR
jgi:hypothetical protein